MLGVTERPSPRDPRATRPRMPDGYGVPETDDGMLPWSWARERLEHAPVYWIASTRPDGRPHVMPSWGAWVDDRFWFEGSPRTRRARNLAANPEAVVHVERGDDAVIVEGRVTPVSDLHRELVDKLLAGFAKYRTTHGYEADAANWRDGGLLELRPRIAFGWSSFPTDTTRWHFDE